MSKRRITVISFAGRRVLLETIASYWPWTVRGTANDNVKHGIAYLLRSGEKVDADGDDKPSRDKAIAFLDKYFKPDKFTGYKCDVCARKSKNCGNEHSCRGYNNFQGFERAAETESE